VRTRSDREAWLVLACAVGIGPRTSGALVRAFGGPARAVGATAAALSEVPGYSGEKGERLARAIAEADAPAVLARAEASGIGVLTPSDDGYPARVKTSPDAPAALFVRGRLPPSAEEGVPPWAAVVGTRAASPYGLRVARTMGEDLGRGGVVVVSGLARGVDGAAHAGALAGGGLTVAVLGCGADVAYPPEHEALATEIAARGAVVSEHPPGTPPHPGHFPRRNRIVAALAHAVIVVEAPTRSGALGTARIAVELGRDVFAVPGPVDRGTHGGCHRLLRDGHAVVCEGARDVWASLGRASPAESASAGASPDATEDGIPAARAGGRPAGRPGGGPALVVWQALDRDDALDADELSRRTGLTPDAVAVAITDLELDGRIVRVPGVGFLRP
jgi:DNA processing protein